MTTKSEKIYNEAKDLLAEIIYDADHAGGSLNSNTYCARMGDVDNNREKLLAIIQDILDDKPLVPLTTLIGEKAFQRHVNDLSDAWESKSPMQSLADQLKPIIIKAERRGANNERVKLEALIKLGGIQQRRLFDSQFVFVSALEQIRQQAENSDGADCREIRKIVDMALAGTVPND